MEPNFFQISLKVVLRNENDEILVLKSPRLTFTGLCDLPGGRINVNEFDLGFKELLEREITEEVGNIVYDLDLRPKAIGKGRNAKNGFDVFYVIFEARYKSGDIRVSEEHADYSWTKLEDIDIEQCFANGLLEAMRNYKQINSI